MTIIEAYIISDIRRFLRTIKYHVLISSIVTHLEWLEVDLQYLEERLKFGVHLTRDTLFNNVSNERLPCRGVL